MKLIRFFEMEADFADIREVDAFREYLETETNMPYDMVDQYVADFIHTANATKEYYIWKLRNGIHTTHRDIERNEPPFV